jgi:hypothetical protein
VKHKKKSPSEHELKNSQKTWKRRTLPGKKVLAMERNRWRPQLLVYDWKIFPHARAQPRILIPRFEEKNVEERALLLYVLLFLGLCLQGGRKRT